MTAGIHKYSSFYKETQSIITWSNFSNFLKTIARSVKNLVFILKLKRHIKKSCKLRIRKWKDINKIYSANKKEKFYLLIHCSIPDFWSSIQHGTNTWINIKALQWTLFKNWKRGISDRCRSNNKELKHICKVILSLLKECLIWGLNKR